MEAEGELIELNQVQDFSSKLKSEQDFCAEVQIKLLKAEFDPQMILLTMKLIHF